MLPPLRPVLFAFALIAVSACGRPPGGHSTAASAPGSGGFIVPPAGEGPAVVATVERKVVRTGELSFGVDDVEVARRTVLDRTMSAGGYVETDTLQVSNAQLLLAMTVCVPTGTFDAVLEALRTLGQLEHQQVEAVDVSAQMVDLEARLGVLSDVAARYRELIARAENIGDVIALQRELAKVLGDNDSMAGQLRTLGENVVMSRLVIRCRAPGPVDAAEHAQFADAFAAGWDGCVRVVVGAAYIWPVWVLGSLVFVSIWVRRRWVTHGHAPDAAG